MIGRRAVIGLSLLSTLLVCAFAAQSASAIVTTPSKNTTAFTCVKTVDNSGDFTKAHCDFEDTGPIGKSEYKHELIEIGATTTIDATNKNVTPDAEKKPTAEKESATLKGEVAGVKVEITCATVQNNTANSWIRNVQPGLGEHTLEGTAETEFKDCEVKLLKKCVVTEPIIAKAKVHGVEGMEGPTGKALEPNAMGVEFIGHGANETFAEIQFTNKGAEACALNKQIFPVKGRVVATNGPTTESDQSKKEAGSTLVFTPKFKMQTLTFGGKPAEFSTIVTPKMPGGNPISLTTTT